MGRDGLIAAALVLAAAAVGLSLWTGVLKLPGQTPGFGTTTTNEDRLVAQMTNEVAGGGYAVTFSQNEASKWQVGEGHRIERFSLEAGSAVFARLSSSTPLNPTTWEWSTQGLSTTFPVEFNNATNGQEIEIGVIARAATANPSSEMSVVYATQQAGNSGWHPIALTGEFALTKFTFTVPKVDDGAYTKQPILVINADKAGGGKSVEVLGVYVKKL